MPVVNLLEEGQERLWLCVSLPWLSWCQTLGETVLVSARIELIFFLVAGAVLCFGFGVRAMLTAPLMVLVVAG